jgi:hypothetical protein
MVAIDGAAIESPGSNFWRKKGWWACALTPGGSWGLPPGSENGGRYGIFRKGKNTSASEHLSGGALYLGPIYGATARQKVPFRGNGRNASANIR